MVLPARPLYRRQVLDHLGLVAGLFDALGSGDVLDQASPQHPAMRDLTVGDAVTAMGRHGLGLIKQTLDRVPQLFQHQPTVRLLAPRMAPAQLNDDALGRALETLYAYGVTARYRLMAATAAERLGRAPRLTHRERPSVPVDGRDHRDAEPAAQVVPITRGSSREHRPELHHVRVELIVAPQAGMPMLMQPLRGHSRDAQDVGAAVRTHGQPWHTTDGLTSLVADRAL